MRRWLAAIAVVVLFGATAADAHDAVNVVAGKAHVMRLNQDAGVVLIADPTIADVAVESPRLIFILGRRPGETNLNILDDDGKEIVHVDVVVVPNPDRVVTVHRGVAEATLSCAPRCASVATPGGGGPAAPPATSEE